MHSCYAVHTNNSTNITLQIDQSSVCPQLLKDWHLALGVLTLVLVDLTILLVYTTVEGARGRLKAIRVPSGGNPTVEVGACQLNLINIQLPLSLCQLTILFPPPQDIDRITLSFTYSCSSTPRNIFLGILYGYKMILQVIALVLAFSTHKVKVKGLDDAKYIAATIYVTSIVLAVIMVATYSLKNFVNAFPTLFCTGFFIGTTSILGLAFVPKVGK